VPEEHHVFRTKPEIALAEIDCVIERGLSFRVLLADAGYGLSAFFRQGLSKRGPSASLVIRRSIRPELR
jgi:SRSO17 transposase